MEIPFQFFIFLKIYIFNGFQGENQDSGLSAIYPRRYSCILLLARFPSLWTSLAINPTHSSKPTGIPKYLHQGDLCPSLSLYLSGSFLLTEYVTYLVLDSSLNSEVWATPWFFMTLCHSFTNHFHIIRLGLQANISWFKKRLWWTVLNMKFFFIFRLLHGSRITWSKQATSYLMHWLTLEILSSLTLTFNNRRAVMMIHFQFLKSGTHHLQKASVVCGDMVLLQRVNPVKTHADTLNINISSLHPCSLACQTQFEWSFLLWSFGIPISLVGFPKALLQTRKGKCFLFPAPT